jgi:hypothetical protein
MTNTAGSLRGMLLAALLGASLLPSAWADFELKDAQGRFIQLKDDGTWRYLDATEVKPPAVEPPKDPVQAELLLERRVDAVGGCLIELTLVNRLGYEIRSFAPDFTVYRANDVAYTSKLTVFGPVRPGDRQQRALQFVGIACNDIAKLQVSGGERCEMGDLNKFSDAKGQCLARVRVPASDKLRIEKAEALAAAPAPAAASAPASAPTAVPPAAPPASPPAASASGAAPVPAKKK